MNEQITFHYNGKAKSIKLESLPTYDHLLLMAHSLFGLEKSVFFEVNYINDRDQIEKIETNDALAQALEYTHEILLVGSDSDDGFFMVSEPQVIPNVATVDDSSVSFFGSSPIEDLTENLKDTIERVRENSREVFYTVKDTVLKNVEIVDDSIKDTGNNVKHFVSEQMRTRRSSLGEISMEELDVSLVQLVNNPDMETNEIDNRLPKGVNVDKLLMLEELGFVDRPKNIKYLKRYSGSIDRAVAELLK
eukprot:TRINITY_DN9088_c0_g1_i1.p1 TRINITY_DN9088_c0_g1~~TRINITY_DN9088_c0_g1_i1.p1  ORF type:complete len:248 (+),score=68.53 TRINITY_DN9088_c0_g1_i1:26-769(+)